MHPCWRHEAQWGWERNVILNFCGKSGEGNHVSDKMTNLQESAPIIITLSVVRLASLQVAAFSA